MHNSELYNDILYACGMFARNLHWKAICVLISYYVKSLKMADHINNIVIY